MLDFNFNEENFSKAWPQTIHVLLHRKWLNFLRVYSANNVIDVMKNISKRVTGREIIHVIDSIVTILIHVESLL